jgi:PAS domain S-box-containing protein
LPFAVSTRLYPAAPFVKAPHTSITLATAVTLALLGMPRDSEAAKWADSAGYTLPMSYAPLHECLRQLRLDPYTDYGKVTLAGAIQQHWSAAILLLASIALGFAATTWRVAHLNRLLRRSLGDLDYQRQLIAQTSEAILAAGPDGCITFLNSAAERLLGWWREKALGRPAGQVMRWSSGGQAGVETLAQLAGNAHWSGERLIQGASGEPRRVELSVSAMRSPAGEAAGIVACIRDVTALRSVEEQYRQSQKLESVGRLAAGVAHDFNNLLTIIIGYCEFLLKPLKTSDSSRNYVLEIRKAGERAASLTKQLLALSRKQVIEPRVLDLNATIRESAPMLRRLIGEDIALETHLESSLGQVMADPDQLHQVIMNLAINARDAMPDGGRIDIATANLEVGPEDGAASHPDAAPGLYVAMTVTDTGHGMDETIRKKIFEPFFTTKEVGKGTGLGLSTVHGIVRQNGGWIDVWSEVGAGTRFRMLLPRVDAAALPERNAIVAPGKGGRETILLVEDQEAVRNFTVAALRRNGYRVLEAFDGDRAIDVAERFSGEIHLLLTDVVMPGMNGKDLSERLKKLRPNLKVLFVSGYTADVIAHRGVLDRSVSLLYKPFGPDELAAKVRVSLDDTPR